MVAVVPRSVLNAISFECLCRALRTTVWGSKCPQVCPQWHPCACDFFITVTQWQKQLMKGMIYFCSRYQRLCLPWQWEGMAKQNSWWQECVTGSCSHHSRPGGRERLTGTRSYYNPQRLVPNDLLPPPGPSSYGFHSFQTSWRTSMWNMSSWEAFQTQGSSLYPQMTRGIGTNTEDTPRLFLPIVHLVITTVTKLWRTITHSWASNPNPGTPVPSFLS